MAQCNLCHKEIPFLEWMKAPQLNRCKECDRKLSNVQHYWMNMIEKTFASDGVPPQLEQDLYKNFQELSMPPDLGQKVIQRLQYLRTLSEIRWGHIPVIRADIHLDSDEIAHFSLLATHHQGFTVII